MEPVKCFWLAVRLHDYGSVFSDNFREKLARLGITSVRTAYRSPWQNPYVERVIGTLRREGLDHIILFNEKHLRRVLDEFVEEYYNPDRPHLSLDRNSPIPRKSDPPSQRPSCLNPNPPRPSPPLPSYSVGLVF